MKKCRNRCGNRRLLAGGVDALNCNEIKRGDILYVNQGNASCGSEQYGGRPAIVVSNDMCNRYSQVITVVFLTTKEKKPLPTHVQITSSRYDSTALCEQVESVSKERLGNYMATCSKEEMIEIDQAIAVALGLKLENEDEKRKANANLGESDIAIKTERDVYKQLYERLISQLLK